MGKTIRKYSQEEYNTERRKFYGEYAKGPRPLGAYKLPSKDLSFYEDDPEPLPKGPRHRKTYPMYGKK